MSIDRIVKDLGTVAELEKVETRNAACPACGGRHLDRYDVEQVFVRRRVEAIEESDSWMGLRPMSSQLDRQGPTGRGSERIECADCLWSYTWESGSATSEADQALLASLVRGRIAVSSGPEAA